MASNDHIKNAVLDKVFSGRRWHKVGRAKFASNGHVVHVRYCSPASKNNPHYKFNINHNTLTADYELWICGSENTYYLIPMDVIREMYNHPDAYVDNHHPDITIVSVYTNKHEVMYAAGGTTLNLYEFYRQTL